MTIKMIEEADVLCSALYGLKWDAAEGTPGYDRISRIYERAERRLTRRLAAPAFQSPETEARR